MFSVKWNTLYGLLVLLFSLSSHANCLSLDKPVELRGQLSTAVDQQSARFYVLQIQAVWCAAEANQDKDLTVVYIPKIFISQRYMRLIDENIIQGPVKVSGKLKLGPELDGKETYQIKPKSIYVTELDIDLLEHFEGQPKSIDTIGSESLMDIIGSDDLMSIEPAAGGEDTGTGVSLFPAFPDPVPTPSKRTNIQLFTPEAIQADTLKLGDAEKKLRLALKEGGYEELSYYSFDNGFAIATPLEQTDNEANPLNENRWVGDVEQSKVFSLSSFFKALFLADEGYFRVLVFIVNDKPIQFGEKVDKQALMDVIDEGSNRLPGEITKRAFNVDMLTTALVYEFEHDENTRSIINKRPGRHSIKRHLSSTNAHQSLDL